MKLKTNKSASKRYKVSKNAKFFYRHACLGHLLIKKSNKQKRKLMQISHVHKHDHKTVKNLLCY